MKYLVNQGVSATIAHLNLERQIRKWDEGHKPRTQIGPVGSAAEGFVRLEAMCRQALMGLEKMRKQTGESQERSFEYSIEDLQVIFELVKQTAACSGFRR